MKEKRMTLLFLGVLIIAGVVVLIALRQDYHNIIDLFSKMNFFWFFIAFTCMIVYNLIDIIFIKYAYSKKKKSYTLLDSFIVQQVGNFFNLVDPFGGSGNAAQPIMLKKQGIDYDYSSSVVMITFISYQTILVLVTSLIMIFFHDFDISPAMVSIIVIGFLINFVVIFTLISASLSKRFQEIVIIIVSFVIDKLKFLKNGESIVKNLDDSLTSFREEVKDLFLDKKLIVRRLIADFLKLIIYFSITFFVALALNVDLGIDEFILCFVLTSFVYIVSSITPTPGSVGGAEASFLFIFGSLLHSSTASVMLLWRFLVTYLPMIIGFIVFAISGRMYKNNEK